MNYRPGTWYWEFIIVLRKFLIAFCSLMFRRTPSYQLAMALLVLFVAYVLQQRSRPYMSHAVAQAVPEEHRAKVLEGDKLHGRIESAMKTQALLNGRSSSSESRAGVWSMSMPGASGGGRGGRGDLAAFFAAHRTGGQVAVLQGRSIILKHRALSIMFDYNTAESALLASAVLVSLAGICFDSSRFSGDSGRRPEVIAEYDSLTFAILIVLFVSIVYWIVSLVLDICLVAAPIAASGCIRGTARLGRRVKAAVLLKKAKQGQGALASGSSKKDVTAEGGALATPELMTNPILVRAAAAGSYRAEDLDISGLEKVPDDDTWKLVRSAYVKMADRSRNMQTEIEELRRAIAQMGSGTPAADRPGGKQAFEPLGMETGGSRFAGFFSRAKKAAAVDKDAAPAEEAPVSIVNPMLKKSGRQLAATSANAGAIVPGVPGEGAAIAPQTAGAADDSSFTVENPQLKQSIRALVSGSATAAAPASLSAGAPQPVSALMANRLRKPVRTNLPPGVKGAAGVGGVGSNRLLQAGIKPGVGDKGILSKLTTPIVSTESASKAEGSSATGSKEPQPTPTVSADGATAPSETTSTKP